jgi:HEPN domain-containing protein
VNALYQQAHAIAWGHAVSRLLNDLPGTAKPSSDLIEVAMRLDRYYIATRYPNGFERGSPQDYYSQSDAQEAINYAQLILEFCDHHLSEWSGNDSGAAGDRDTDQTSQS